MSDKQGKYMRKGSFTFRIISILILGSLVLSFSSITIPEEEVIHVNWKPDNIITNRQSNTTYTIIVGPFACIYFFGGMIEDNPHIEVTVVLPDGTKYTTNTDGSVDARFNNMPWPNFPKGTNFTATRNGFHDIHWQQGEQIPTMYAKRDNSLHVVCGVICGVLIVLFFIAFLILLILVILFIWGIPLATSKKPSRYRYRRKRRKSQNKPRPRKKRGL